MVDIRSKALEEREKLRRDLRRSEVMRADIRAKLARGKDLNLLEIWVEIEKLDVAIGRKLRELTSFQ